MILETRAAASQRSGEVTEGVGFEPTVSFPTLDFESSTLNRTQPPFQSVDIVGAIFTMRNCQARSEFAKPRHHASVKWRWRSHSPTAELRRGSFMNSDARLATSR